MHPALSVIFFTVSSGAGYGLFTLLAVALGFGFESNLAPREAFVSGVIATALITFGLISSTFHLANPKNAWRAFSRFRTSWLAREGVLAIAFYPFAFIFLFLSWKGIELSAHPATQVLTLLITVLAMATVFSTGMIYACLKTIRQWNTALTPLNYIALSLMLGSLFFTALMEFYGQPSGIMLMLTGFFIIIAAVIKTTYFFWMRIVDGPTINTATSFTRANVRLLDVGHTAGTFLTDEFGYRLAHKKLLMIRYTMLALAFLAPVLLIGSRAQLSSSEWLSFAALIVAFCGVFTERWLFFAEARHVVNLYHGMQNAQGR